MRLEEEKIARKLRNWFPGATYHLMERGIRRLAIFQDEMDFEMFLEILKKEAMEKECKIHAYCLMTNHFHLLVETGNVEIGKFNYSKACNRVPKRNYWNRWRKS